MSTEIYTGFKFKGTDIFQIHDDINVVRKEVNTKAKELASIFFAEYMTNVFDSDQAVPYAKKLSKNTKPYQVIAQHYFDKVRALEQSDQRMPDIDFSFVVNIYFHEGEIYGTVYTERQEFLDIWFEKDYVEDFAYWNNTNKPKEITKKEWQSRRDVWNFIFKNSNIPAYTGFNCKLVKLPIIPDIDEIMEQIPAFEDRCDALSKDWLFRERNKDKQIDSGNMVALYTEFNDWLETPDGRIEKAKRDGYFENELKKELVKEDFI